MYQDINTFIPFFHENIDSKSSLLEFARSKDVSKVEDVLAAALIYTNLVDYLAQHTLTNLRKMLCIASYKQFKATLYIDLSETKNNQSLGNVIKDLRLFGFPDKEGFIKLLEDFNKLRIRVVHELMKQNLKDSGSKFDQDLTNIRKLAEEILTKYNLISSGITSNWQAFAPK